ncbi:MAG: serine/threonine-protein kinase [Acidobacteria bacterium]|nr:serine/threonine-protein kinase [Acidobacteriota bacterium]
MSDRRLLESVADAGEAVDWSDVERAAAKGRDAGLLEQLKVVSGIGAGRRSHELRGPTKWNRWRETCVAVVLCIAVAQLALAILGAPAGLAQVAWLHVVNVLMFGVGGVVLLAGGGRDSRLPLLGGLFVTIASAFAATLMPPPEPGHGGMLLAVFRPLLPEAFLPLMLWRFVRRFPVDVQQSRARRVSGVFADVSFGVGTVLFAANAIRGFGGWTIPAWAMALADVLDRYDAKSVYWPLLFAIAAPAIPFLLWKARFETHEDRRRVMLFVGALAVGLAPFVLAVVATPFVSALHDVPVQQRVGVVLYGALASIVPLTAYSVAVDRVMDLRFLIRSTLKYATARYAVWAMSLGPIAYVGFDIYANQELTIGQYFQRSRPVGPLALSAMGLVTLTFRQHFLRVIDRWFLVAPGDQSQTMARLEERFRVAGSLRGVAQALAGELSRAMHAPTVAVLLLNDDGTKLIPVEGTTGPILRESTLVEILQSMRGDVQFDARALRSIGRLLLPADRAWLRDSGARLLAPLIGSSGTLLGMVALGKAGSGLPYTAPHFALVTAACGRAAMQIEYCRLRGQEGRTAGRHDRGDRRLNWRDEPAVQCPACSLVWSPETRRCSCGAATTVAVLPLFIQGKFRLERMIGAGGMGVVYCAIDMVLDRRVAIKTLPSLGHKSAERLHREARTMARVVHPNLALIYGTEEWRGTPMLVVEYLNGGTLRDWLRRGPLSYTSAIDLGIVLADILDRVHEAGVLHRDVKPSNIGYTSDRRPKLLDFGLALLGPEPGDRAKVESLSARARKALDRSTDPGITVTVAERLVGTPLYLAPEALAGATPQPSFDLWGLALVLYEALAGRHPFAAADSATVLAAVERTRVPDIRDYRPTSSAELATFLRNALSPSTSRRPPSAAAMGAELRRLRGAPG